MDEIHEDRHIASVKVFASELVEHVTTFRRRRLDQLGWVAVPVESGCHFDENDAKKIAAAALASQSSMIALPTESLAGEPVGYRVEASQEDLQEFSHQCGHFNYVLVADDSSFAVLCTVDDYFLVAGPEEFVRHAVGGDLGEAWRSFKAFASDPDWTEEQRSALHSVVAAYDV